MKKVYLLWIVAVVVAATPLVLMAAGPCDKTTPGDSKPCGSSQACENGDLFTGCDGTFIKSNKYVYTCDGPEGTCSQKCGSHGEATCTESFECEEGDQVNPDDPDDFEIECNQGDALLDGENNPVVSKKDKMGAVSCDDTCG